VDRLAGSEAAQEVEHAAVSDRERALCAGTRDVLEPRCDPRKVSAAALAARNAIVRLEGAEGVEVGGVARPALGLGQALEDAEAALGEAGIEPIADKAKAIGGLHRAPERADVDALVAPGVESNASERRADPFPHWSAFVQ